MGDRKSDSISALGRYFGDIRGFPQLDRDSEHQLARDRQSGSKTAVNELVEANLQFVVKVASEYRNLGLPFEDLLNEGNLGLIEAAQRFEDGKGTKFITYAIWWIRKEILRALSEHSNLVRVPTYQRKKVNEIRHAEDVLTRRLGRRPRRDEISARLDRTVSQVDNVLQFYLREMSLDDDQFGKNHDKSITDFLADINAVDPEADLLKRETNALIAQAIHDLTGQEIEVIALRFGLRDGHSRTLKEVGELMAISRERVRQIENQAKRRLRTALNRANKLPPERSRPRRLNDDIDDVTVVDRSSTGKAKPQSGNGDKPDPDDASRKDNNKANESSNGLREPDLHGRLPGL